FISCSSLAPLVFAFCSSSFLYLVVRKFLNFLLSKILCPLPRSFTFLRISLTNF
ncbi:unnamed protein product, partial [Brassica oleracea var. botrytis]